MNSSKENAASVKTSSPTPLEGRAGADSSGRKSSKGMILVKNDDDEEGSKRDISPHGSSRSIPGTCKADESFMDNFGDHSR